jgi:putative oxidoreductase
VTTRHIEDLWAPRLLSIVRIVAALLLWQYGLQKMLGFPPGRDAPEVFSMTWFAGVLEFVLCPLLLVGLLTRPVAFILAGEMAFAYWLAHAPRSFYPVLNGGNLAILFCVVFLYLAAAGGGSWSLDALLGRRERQRA